MWPRRSFAASRGPSPPSGSPTISPASCPARPRSRPHSSPSALSSMSANTIASAVATAALPQIDTPLLAIALAQGTDVPASLAALDKAAGGLVARALTSGDFQGKRDGTSLLYPPAGKPQRILPGGVGKARGVTRNAMRRAPAVGARGAPPPWAKRVPLMRKAEGWE